MSIVSEIRERLFAEADGEYRQFQARIIPNVNPDSIIGVRTPFLRKYAKELAKRADIGEFLTDLPHKHFDENNLHSFIICETKDYATAVAQVDSFLPFVDNWATCDQMRPKAFDKNTDKLKSDIDRYLKSDEVYTVRFGIEMLMTFYLDDRFYPESLNAVAHVTNGDYYVKMMVAWYFATALTKRWDDAIPYIESRRLEKWTHNKAIQKGIESNCISSERKEYLKSLKIK